MYNVYIYNLDFVNLASLIVIINSLSLLLQFPNTIYKDAQICIRFTARVFIKESYFIHMYMYIYFSVCMYFIYVFMYVCMYVNVARKLLLS